mmetsp:Transcript_112670/g.273608  ORF Transcript_112670/g.273608 Transcript_112670/m.273608 type:complete len:235 (-) Transcript_112670:256-960(-)
MQRGTSRSRSLPPLPLLPLPLPRCHGGLLRLRELLPPLSPSASLSSAPLSRPRRRPRGLRESCSRLRASPRPWSRLRLRPGARWPLGASSRLRLERSRRTLLRLRLGLLLLSLAPCGRRSSWPSTLLSSLSLAPSPPSSALLLWPAAARCLAESGRRLPPSLLFSFPFSSEDRLSSLCSAGCAGPSALPASAAGALRSPASWSPMARSSSDFRSSFSFIRLASSRRLEISARLA